MPTRRRTYNRSHMEPISIVNAEDIRAVLHSDLSGVNLGVVDRLRLAVANEPGSASAALGSIHGTDDHHDCACGPNEGVYADHNHPGGSDINCTSHAACCAYAERFPKLGG